MALMQRLHTVLKVICCSHRARHLAAWLLAVQVAHTLHRGGQLLLHGTLKQLSGEHMLQC
jgi:hypothetical protein